MARLEAEAALIAVLYDAGSDAGPLMRRLVGALGAAGCRCAGFVQRDVERPDRTRCDMVLEDIGSGQSLPISEDRGALARGCRLDEDGLSRAIAAALAALASKPDVLVVNKFGKSESEGRGFRPLIAAAVEAEIPVIVPVPWRNAESWRSFAGEMSREHGLATLEGLGEAELLERIGVSVTEAPGTGSAARA